MKIILFLAAVYSLIINQSQQKSTPANNRPASYVSPAVYTDSMAEAIRAVRIEHKKAATNNNRLASPLQYTLFSAAVFKE